MKANERKAFNELKAIGAPVIERPEGDGDGPFVLSAEDNDSRIWADYYSPEFGLFGVAQDVTDILESNGLFAEWINPGMVGVYQA
ncbi:hypothetical protein MAL1_00001 [Bacteriophage DSS3_MAL1]|nr:hypothetical protein MAL1_00001 [Bacteriophage DSS3_MAL1]